MKKNLFFGSLASLLLVLALIVLALMVFCAKPSPALAREKVQIKILTAKFGGGSYIIGAALAEMINKHSPWLRATAVETGGCTDNIKRGYDDPVERKICLRDLDAFSSWAAPQGIEPFDKAYTGMKWITFIFAPVNAMFTLDPNIKTPKDLIGKKVCMGGRTSGIRAWSKLYMDYCWGLEGKYDKVWLGFGAAKDNLLDGTIDATIGALNVIMRPDGKAGYKLHPSIEEPWTLKPNSHFICATKQEFEKAKKTMRLPPAYSWAVVPAGALGPRQTEALGMGADLCNYGAYDMDDDVAYEICRVIYEHFAELGGVHSMGKGIHPKTMGWLIAQTKAEVHPGALKFYKEHNIRVYVGGNNPTSP